MAFASGKESIESTPIKKYVGVCPVHVLAVNPSKAELEKIYNTTLDKDPEYLKEVEVGEDNHKVKTVRLDFIVRTDPNYKGIDVINKVSFFLRREYRYNRDKTKVQVIDKYGRTAWVTVEQAKNHEIPLYSNGYANLDKDYRPCYVGEEGLTEFIKTYLCIPNVMKYVNNVWVMVDNPSDCEARLEKIEDYFNGKYDELRQVIALQPNNKVKVLFGVKNSEDNRQYQTIYTEMFIRNNSNTYTKLEKSVTERKSAGAYSNVEFSFDDIKEYDVKPTNFSTPENKVEDLPFGKGEEGLPW